MIRSKSSSAAYHYPHLTLPLPDRMMVQSFLDYLNLLHAQRGNFKLISLVLVAELISKPSKPSYINILVKIRYQFFKILNLTLFYLTKNVTVRFA